jgi:hypothetical protein
MNRITVCEQIEKKSKTKIFDVTDKEREVEIILFEFKPLKDIVIPQVDYSGNLYLKHVIEQKTSNNDEKGHDEKSVYYMISLDQYSETGIDLTPIKNPNTFRKNLLESGFSKNNVRSGEIKTNKTTLRGKAYKSLKNMSSEEREEHEDSHEYFLFDDTFKESQYYWVQYKEEDQNYEDEYDNTFYINGAHEENDQNAKIDSKNKTGLTYSDLLILTSPSFDSILIQGDERSESVISTVERCDGSCFSRLTLYTSGFIKINFIDKIREARLCMVNNVLVAKSVSN